MKPCPYFSVGTGVWYFMGIEVIDDHAIKAVEPVAKASQKMVNIAMTSSQVKLTFNGSSR